MVQKLFGICEGKNGTEIEELLQAGASRQKSTENVLNGSRSLRMPGFWPRR